MFSLTDHNSKKCYIVAGQLVPTTRINGITAGFKEEHLDQRVVIARSREEAVGLYLRHVPTKGYTAQRWSVIGPMEETIDPQQPLGVCETTAG